tara:strand:+ start:221 stop:490 length:270 start_codon:yes stop_codon:yes gene_type:complete
MDKFKILENELQNVIDMYASYFINEGDSFKGILENIKLYEENKKNILKELNKPLDQFLLNHEQNMTISEKDKFNAIAKRYERKLIYNQK